MIVIDVVSKSDGVENLNRARVDENATDNQAHDATKDIVPEKIHRSEKTFNAKRPTLNAQLPTQIGLSVER